MRQILDTQLHDAIGKLNTKQKKTLLSLAKVMAEEDAQSYDPWKDKSFVAEMDRRYKEYKSGKAKLVTLDEAERNARALIETRRAKKAS